MISNVIGLPNLVLVNMVFIAFLEYFSSNKNKSKSNKRVHKVWINISSAYCTTYLTELDAVRPIERELNLSCCTKSSPVAHHHRHLHRGEKINVLTPKPIAQTTNTIILYKSVNMCICMWVL